MAERPKSLPTVRDLVKHIESRQSERETAKQRLLDMLHQLDQQVRSDAKIIHNHLGVPAIDSGDSDLYAATGAIVGYLLNGESLAGQIPEEQLCRPLHDIVGSQPVTPLLELMPGEVVLLPDGQKSSSKNKEKRKRSFPFPTADEMEVISKFPAVKGLLEDQEAWEVVDGIRYLTLTQIAAMFTHKDSHKSLLASTMIFHIRALALHWAEYEQLRLVKSNRHGNPYLVPEKGVLAILANLATRSTQNSASYQILPDYTPLPHVSLQGEEVKKNSISSLQ